MLAEVLLNKLSSDKNAVCFESKRCLRNRLNSNNCTICTSRCQSSALAIDTDGISLNKEQCTGCMLCVTACPNDALSSEFDPILFAQQVKKNEPVVLSCKINNHENGHVHIPCIGVLSEPLLAAIHCLAKISIMIDVSSCSRCNNGHTLSHLKENERTLVKKLTSLSGHKTWNRCDLKIELISENRAEAASEKSVDRRSFFKAVKDSVLSGSESLKSFTEQPGSSVLASQNGGGVSSDKSPVNISKVLQLALDELPEQELSERAILYLYYSTLSANEHCDCCPLCVGICPTGALKRKRDTEGKKIIFLSSLCSGCGLCKEFCKKKALSIHQGSSGSTKGAITISRRCGSKFL